MRVLVACEFSGVVRDAFIARGYDAISADILPSILPGPHIQEDIRRTGLLQREWDLVIAHPPCTYLANIGSRWNSRKPVRLILAEQAAEFFLECLNANAAHIAVENPVMSMRAYNLVGRKPDFYIQPYEHGEPYSKKTGFWTKNLPPLRPSNLVEPTNVVQYLRRSWGPYADLRINGSILQEDQRLSITPSGLGSAMADQWGAYVQKEAGRSPLPSSTCGVD